MTLRSRKKNEKPLRKTVSTPSNVLYNTQKVLNKITHSPAPPNPQVSQLNPKHKSAEESASTRQTIIQSVSTSNPTNPLVNKNMRKSAHFEIAKKEISPKDAKPLINTKNNHYLAPQPIAKASILLNNVENGKAQDILPPKPLLKYKYHISTTATNAASDQDKVNNDLKINSTNKNHPSLFHPSKINMSSTPIKTHINGDSENSKHF